jgi:predicted RNA-binding Zn-ribbon protein involved in translation (DUF1610 family)
MRCYKCRKSVHSLSCVSVGSTVDYNSAKHLCPQCAAKFIEVLARWKDFDPYEEVKHWNGDNSPDL